MGSFWDSATQMNARSPGSISLCGQASRPPPSTMGFVRNRKPIVHVCGWANHRLVVREDQIAGLHAPLGFGAGSARRWAVSPSRPQTKDEIVIGVSRSVVVGHRLDYAGLTDQICRNVEGPQIVCRSCRCPNVLLGDVERDQVGTWTNRYKRNRSIPSFKQESTKSVTTGTSRFPWPLGVPVWPRQRSLEESPSSRSRA